MYLHDHIYIRLSIIRNTLHLFDMSLYSLFDKMTFLIYRKVNGYNIKQQFPLDSPSDIGVSHCENTRISLKKGTWNLPRYID